MYKVIRYLPLFAICLFVIGSCEFLFGGSHPIWHWKTQLMDALRLIFVIVVSAGMWVGLCLLSLLLDYICRRTCPKFWATLGGNWHKSGMRGNWYKKPPRV